MGAINATNAVVIVAFVIYQYHAIRHHQKARTAAFLQVFWVYFIGSGISNLVYVAALLCTVLCVFALVIQ